MMGRGTQRGHGPQMSMRDTLRCSQEGFLSSLQFGRGPQGRGVIWKPVQENLSFEKSSGSIR